MSFARHAFRQESYTDADVDSRTGRQLDVGIHNLERSGASKTNGGLFENGLLKAMETDNFAGGYAREVKVVANGHCHGTYSVPLERKSLANVNGSYGEL